MENTAMVHMKFVCPKCGKIFVYTYNEERFLENENCLFCGSLLTKHVNSEISKNGENNEQ